MIRIAALFAVLASGLYADSIGGYNPIDRYVFGYSSGTPAVLTLNSANGPTSSVNSTHIGWYDMSGFHAADNYNYLAGNCCGSSHNNFFTFVLPALSGPLQSASISIYNPPNGVSDAPVKYSLYSVSTPVATLSATNYGRTDIYSDLGSGALFGTRAVTGGEQGVNINIVLNAAALAAIEASSGGWFALGGTIDDPAPGVPEPGSALLLGGGALLLLVGRRRPAR